VVDRDIFQGDKILSEDREVYREESECRSHPDILHFNRLRPDRIAQSVLQGKYLGDKEEFEVLRRSLPTYPSRLPIHHLMSNEH